MCSAQYFSLILNKLRFSLQIFIAAPPPHSNKFHENPSSGSRADTCGHDKGNWRFSRVFERA